MPDTRNKPDLVALIDKKFDEFKISLLAELRADIDTVLSKEKEEITNYVNEKKDELINFSNNLEYVTSFNEIQKHVKKLQVEQTAMKVENASLKSQIDDLQQYVRRPNIRIYGVKVDQGESNVGIKKKVGEAGVS